MKMKPMDSAMAHRLLSQKDDEIEQLRAALLRYGMHEGECPENDAPWLKAGCTCGFDKYEQKL